jgi:hypothetical protein
MNFPWKDGITLMEEDYLHRYFLPDLSQQAGVKQESF